MSAAPSRARLRSVPLGGDGAERRNKPAGADKSVRDEEFHDARRHALATRQPCEARPPATGTAATAGTPWMRALRCVVARLAVLAALLATLALGSAAAFAGQNCEARKPTLEELRQSLELAAATARRLDETGARVVILARAGQNLEAYRLRYSHLDIAYRDEAALDGRGGWRVVHKLNHCGSDRADLYRQGLAEFFADGLHRWEAGVVVLPPALQAELALALADDRRLVRLHEPRYNMLAYPWATRYQQSNQWAIETLAMLIDPAVDTRVRAQAWLRLRDYRPTTLHVPAVKRLGARVGTAHISFDDHPFDRRMAGRIDTVTVDSVFDWLQRSGLGGVPMTIRATDRPAPLPPRRA